MAIHLYKKGFTHIVNGLQCEIVTCQPHEYESLKAQGLVDDVEDLHGIAKEVAPVAEPVAATSEAPPIYDFDTDDSEVDFGEPAAESVAQTKSEQSKKHK